MVGWDWGRGIDWGWLVNWSWGWCVNWGWGSLIDWGWGSLVDWSRLVDWGSLDNNWSSLVDWSWSSLVDWGSLHYNWGSFVDWSSLVGWSRFISWGSIISSLTRVRNISHISTVGISNIVGDSLGPAIREGYRVGSTGSISISVLSSLEVGSRVVISNSIVVGIDSRFIIAGLLVGRSRSISIPGSIVSSSNGSKSEDSKDLNIRKGY